ncbi:Nif3-like dinuclear metal center hexameric protein [Alloscardovia criceti]|uniref:Nif3-like dinuclear metal center hexameric protein n=1 Tax=Alloscardovia criceti TaxID=356828 RepID=UPI00037786F3|nr:Nif3-like dinuclear metal center hexameric protein [Alloscardovia criceti]
MAGLNVAQCVEVLEELYPISFAEEWDEPGLIVGDPSWPVDTVYCAVDPTEETVKDAIAQGAGLMITHHPLYFRATHTVSGTTFRGSLVNMLIENHCALWVGHTNVDSAQRGQGEAFVQALELVDEGALIPVEADPAYPRVGLGRVGRLREPMSLQDFARRIADTLPDTHNGIFVSGDVEKLIQRIAVLPGSGDSEIEAAAASGADVYVTSDLRHHPALDARQEFSMALINTPHSAIEKLCFNLMTEDLPRALQSTFNQSVDMYISTLNTDPWDMRI